MLKNELKSENLTRNSIILRASLRGLKKCTCCGCINGQRALICSNVECDLRIKRLAKIKPFDPIQLITYGQTKLYSLRSREKLLQPRVFVSITETRESLSCAVAQGITEYRSCAICYVDNCKYDAFETNHLVCRHIKACKVLTDVAVAETYPIDKSILWNLNIPVQQKHHLWQLYQLEEKLIHPVQKLNSSIFVVKCVESKIFPAGRLHVSVFSNKAHNKSGKFFCSCKKLKIMLESDNSVVMKQEICDHVLLLLSAILNKPEGKTLYGKFLDSLQYLWMPTCLNTPVVYCDTRPLQRMNYDLTLDKCNTSTCTKVENNEVCENTEDIFNFNEELFPDNNIPDFSDITLDDNNDKVSDILNFNKLKQTSKKEMHLKDPKLNVSASSSINDEEIRLNFLSVDSPETLTTTYINGANTQIPIFFNENGLSVIEQFQLNHNMQISKDNIELAKDIESLNNLESKVMETSTVFPQSISKQKSLLKCSSTDSYTEEHVIKTNLIIKPTISLKTFPVQKSVVLQQGSVKIIKIAKPIKKLTAEKFIKIIPIPKVDQNEKILIRTNQYIDSTQPTVDGCNVLQSTFPAANRLLDKQINSIIVPSLSYESWLDYVIENINENITIQDASSIERTFHVPEAMFNHFSKTFILNSKRRLSTKTTVVRNEKFKERIINTWHFNQACIVQRIFKSKNVTIELERSYQRLPDGSYELYKPTTITNLTGNNHFRTIYPKVELYKVFMQFSNNMEISTNNLQRHKCGLKLEWEPYFYPKSNFGLMTVNFSVRIKKPYETA